MSVAALQRQVARLQGELAAVRLLVRLDVPAPELERPLMDAVREVVRQHSADVPSEIDLASIAIDVLRALAEVDGYAICRRASTEQTRRDG